MLDSLLIPVIGRIKVKKKKGFIRKNKLFSYLHWKQINQNKSCYCYLEPINIYIKNDIL